MARTYPCEPVGLDFAATAPFRFVSTVDLTITPEQLFEVLADAESWPHWATVITKVVWTSPNRVASGPPVPSACAAASSARKSSWRGTDSHMAFRFDEASNAISAFAEDYRVVPTGRAAT